MPKKLVKELNTISRVSRMVIIGGSVLAIALMLLAIWHGGKPGLPSVYYSMSLATVATDIFAKAVIFGLIGEYIIKRRS